MARVYFRVLHHIQEFLDALKLFVACHSILVNSLFLERPSVSVTILPWSCGTVNIGQYDTVWDCQKCHIIRIIYQQMLSRIVPFGETTGHIKPLSYYPTFGVVTPSEN